MATNFFVEILALHHFSPKPCNIVHLIKAVEIAKEDQLIHGPLFRLKEIICHLVQITLLHREAGISLANQAL